MPEGAELGGSGRWGVGGLVGARVRMLGIGVWRAVGGWGRLVVVDCWEGHLVGG